MERYYAFWRRLGAGVLDAVILSILFLLCAKFIFSTNHLPPFAWTIILSIVPILYSVLLTGWFGQTVGKIIMGVKVLDLGEKNVIGVKRAIVRESVPIVLQLISVAILVLQGLEVLYLNDDGFSFIESIISMSSFLWFIIELATMLSNKKRRAVHDLMASSVVISLKGLRFDMVDEERAAKKSATID